MIIAIATPTLDYVEGKLRIGGPAYYMATAAVYLEAQMLLITTKSTTSSFLKRLGSNVEVVEVGSGETVFEIEVSNNSRSLRVLRRAVFSDEAILDLIKSYDSVLISTTFNELGVEGLARLVKGRSVAIDVQGLVRREAEHKRVVIESEKVFDLGKYLEGSRHRILRGEKEEFPKECWEDILWCSKQLRSDIVITNGEKPFRAASYTEKKAYEVKPISGIYGEPIGLGDVFMVTLYYYLVVKGEPLLDAVVLASLAASMKLRGKHPWFTLNELYVLKDKIVIREMC